ncbi:hypothetical protein [Mesorhizobium jarvisii]|uniref:hypothetical protein n=1 Tax=Mesorhizobium jarvisii TaxID=1777867 RepID=UPI001317F4E2|nr:hypothetical protein [Mesorhizobium jarvisii]MCH4560679.1 hypothetical protein [Mesorhizobium jarvisii]QGU20703.1 hypothetical protein MCHK_09230 [Mesorhizobium huakuii 7653R]
MDDIGAASGRHSFRRGFRHCVKPHRICNNDQGRGTNRDRRDERLDKLQLDCVLDPRRLPPWPAFAMDQSSIVLRRIDR